MNLRSPSLHRVLIAAGVLAFIPGAAGAETIVGLTTSNGLISFDSATPGTVSTIGTISGLTAGDTLVGIDRRPSLGPNNGVLYAVGVNLATGSARIYTLNETNAVASLVATLAADPADATAPTPFTTVSGANFGIDFNPVVDLRVNVATGLTQLDVPLAFVGGDANDGDAPIDVAVAYSNNFGGATSTTLRGVDVGQDADALVIHSNPNGGLLTTALTLPFNSTQVLGYDVSGLTGTPYFTPNTEADPFTALYAAGPGGVSLIGTIGFDGQIVDIAAPVGIQVPEPGALLLAGTGIMGFAALRRRRRQA
jgi:hypothetical protein